ncbi:MAG: translation elongation factor-like protein [Candidatus Kariarchaeaceae archaeon]|jgi:putative protease
MAEKEVGEVINYFQKIMVAVIEISDTISIGDVVCFEGLHTNFEQEIESMQIHHEAIDVAEAGQTVAIKVNESVRKHDRMLKITYEPD